MRYLCFVNGRNQDEIVKIFEGEAYEIDKLTCNFFDSDQIRKKYRRQFEEFKVKYPQAKNGTVRIFGDNVYSENGQRVLYKKHKVAFNHIIKDIHFLRWFSRRELEKEFNKRIIFDTYILRGIAEFNKELIRINQYLKKIKRDDKKETGQNGGGNRYYRFMRILLNVYEEYRQIYNKPSIDEIWKKHLAVLERTKLEKKQLGKDIVLPNLDEESIEYPGQDESYDLDEDPDRIYYEEPPVLDEPLYDFFTSDYFERYFYDVFTEDNLMVIGELSSTTDEEKLKPWNEVATVCYNGVTHVVNLKHFNVTDAQVFNDSKIIIIYGEEDTSLLRAVLINAIQNRAEVVLISDDPKLLEMYAKKFKSIITILDSKYDQHVSAKRQLVDFFISQYNIAKGHQKK